MTGTDVRAGSCRYLLNQQTLNKYYGMKMQYQFMPKAGDIPTLEKYIIKEENDLVSVC